MRTNIKNINKEIIENAYNKFGNIKNGSKSLNISSKSFSHALRVFNIKRITNTDRAIKKSNLKKEEIKKLYNEGKTIKEIANLFNILPRKMNYYFNLFKIKKRTTHISRKVKGNGKYLTGWKKRKYIHKNLIKKEDIIDLYYNKKINQNLTAKKLNITEEMLRKLMKKFNIPIKKLYGKDLGCWKGGKFYDNDGRKLIYIPNYRGRKNNYVPEHQLIIEKQIGRYLQKGEVIHHKDGNIKNNNIDNLILCSSQKEHMKLHYGE